MYSAVRAALNRKVGDTMMHKVVFYQKENVHFVVELFTILFSIRRRNRVNVVWMNKVGH